jgi:hypothetical protein
MLAIFAPLQELAYACTWMMNYMGLKHRITIVYTAVNDEMLPVIFVSVA